MTEPKQRRKPRKYTDEFKQQLVDEYSCAAEPPVQCGVSHLSRRTEPHRL